jgi:hypothetical protein
MRARSLVPLLCAATLGTALAAPAANAAQAPDWLLSRGDVPTALGTPKPGKVNYMVEGAKPATWDICLPKTGGPEATVGLAAGWDATVVLSGRGYREVNERFSAFASEPTAQATFQQLTAAAAACSGTSRRPVNESGSVRDGVVVNTNTTGTLADGSVWVQTDARSRVPGDRTTVSTTSTYTVYRLAGNAIVVTWLYQNGPETTTGRQRAAVNGLSAQLAQVPTQ